MPGEVALSSTTAHGRCRREQVLHVLKRYKVHATFFMVGNLVERYPAIVREVISAGMPIGDHSWDHPIDPPFADLAMHRLQTEVGTPPSRYKRWGSTRTCSGHRAAATTTTCSARSARTGCAP